ncbi:hypothetical protein DPEC_G00364050 [Dallia pectoralis]|nr:hypothetical protein DPEC_G00364050 [Dallia pectoralis]
MTALGFSTASSSKIPRHPGVSPCHIALGRLRHRAAGPESAAIGPESHRSPRSCSQSLSEQSSFAVALYVPEFEAAAASGVTFESLQILFQICRVLEFHGVLRRIEHGVVNAVARLSLQTTAPWPDTLRPETGPS